MVGGQLPDHWWGATRKCIGRLDWQLHRYNPDLYILRQTACSHAEKPFLYLLFGNDRALLLDTGAEGGERALALAVRAVLGTWLARNHHASIPLVVGHLHSHDDEERDDRAPRHREPPPPERFPELHYASVRSYRIRGSSQP